ncbi:MAG: magnesium transporter [Verrucomicrobiota bacterium]
MPQDDINNQQNLDNLLAQKRWQELLKSLRSTDPADTADYLEELSSDKRDTVFRLLDPATASDVLVEMEPSFLEDIVEDMEALKLAHIADEMAPDDAVDFVADLSRQKQAKVLAYMRNSEEVSKLLGYQEDSAGHVMTTEFFAVSSSYTVRQTREALAPAEFTDPILYVYITDPKTRKLEGVVSIHKLFHSNPSKPISEIAETDYTFCYVDDHQEEVARQFRKYDVWVMPVLDRQHRLLGRITADDIMDVVHEEADKDLSKMIGAPDIEMETGSVMRIVSLRLPWLLVTLFGGLVISLVLKSTLDVINIAILSIFAPAIMMMAGNTGIQTSAIAVRGIALGYQAYSRLFNLVVREICIGIFMGIACGSLTGGMIWGAFLVTGAQADGTTALALAFTAGIAMGNAMIVATCIGAFVPLTLHRLGIDPAVASGPFVTSSIDIIAALIYFLSCSIILL